MIKKTLNVKPVVLKILSVKVLDEVISNTSANPVVFGSK